MCTKLVNSERDCSHAAESFLPAEIDVRELPLGSVCVLLDSLLGKLLTRPWTDEIKLLEMELLWVSHLSWYFSFKIYANNWLGKTSCYLFRGCLNVCLLMDLLSFIRSICFVFVFYSKSLLDYFPMREILKQKQLSYYSPTSRATDFSRLRVTKDGNLSTSFRCIYGNDEKKNLDKSKWILAYELRDTKKHIGQANPPVCVTPLFEVGSYWCLVCAGVSALSCSTPPIHEMGSDKESIPRRFGWRTSRRELVLSIFVGK